MIEESLVEVLQIGVPLVTKIEPLRMPSGSVLPVLTYQRMPVQRQMAHSGPTGFTAARFQIDAWASTYQSAKAVAEQVRNTLNGFRGTMGITTPTTVHAIIMDADLDDYEPELPMYRVIMQALITFKEV